MPSDDAASEATGQQAGMPADPGSAQPTGQDAATGRTRVVRRSRGSLRRVLVVVLGETVLQPDLRASTADEALTSRAQIVRWSRILVRAGFALFAASVLMIFAIPGPVGWPLVTLLVMVAVVVGIYAYRTVKGLRPQPPALPDYSPVDLRLWEQARRYGVALGWRVGVAAFVVEGILTLLALFALAAAGSPAVFWALLASSTALGFWTAKLGREECHDVLAQQTPRRALPTDLVERARDVQTAMEQVAFLAEELQDDVKVQQRVLDEIQRQVVDYQHTAAISKAEAESVARVLDARQERGRRRSFWSGIAVNVAVGFGFYVLGVLTSALVDTDSLRALLHRWLHLG